MVKFVVDKAKERAFTEVPIFAADLADARINYAAGDIKFKSLNTRHLDESKLRHMVTRFSIDLFHPAFVAVRALDREAKDWLQRITDGKEDKVLNALLCVLASKDSLRPQEVLALPEFQSAMTTLNYQKPVKPVQTFQDLVDKGLVFNTGLPRNLRFDPVSGQHSFVFGRMYQRGVSSCDLVIDAIAAMPCCCVVTCSFFVCEP